MTVQKKSRQYDKVDPSTGRWPNVTERAAKISDLIAALQKVMSEEGDLEIIARSFPPYADGESDIEPLWNVMDLLDVVANPRITETNGVEQDGVPVTGFPAKLTGKFLWVETE